MLMRFGAEEIVGHRVLPDGSGVGISFRSGKDNDVIELLLPTRNVQAMFTMLADIMTALSNMAAPLEGQRVNARFPTTFNVAISKDTVPISCAIVFDASRPTMTAYAVAPFAARKMGRELIARAREAEQLSGIPTPNQEPDDVQPPTA